MGGFIGLWIALNMEIFLLNTWFIFNLMYDDMKFKDISIKCVHGMNNIWNI